VTPDVPASILQTHPNMRLFLDPASASRLEAGTISAGV
jgi:6-phosphogluconolactonase/glucosamine-6-phosphate isomerase/deaminase